MGNTTVLRLDDKNHDPIALSIVFDDCFLVTCIAFLLRPESDNGTSAQTTSLAFPKSSILSTNSSASGTLNRLIRDRLVASNVCHVFFKNLADETKASRAILFFFDTSYLKVCFLLFSFQRLTAWLVAARHRGVEKKWELSLLSRPGFLLSAVTVFTLFRT